jgi:dolichol kinase
MTPEAKRKISHWFILLVPAVYIFISPKKTILLLLLIFMLIVVIFEILRKRSEKLNQKLLKIFDGIYRNDEINKTSTLIYTLSGLFFSVLFFEKEIAILSIFFLTFGDGFAALIGEKYGKHKVSLKNKKSWEGVFTNLVTCLIVGFIFSIFFEIKNIQIIFGSAVATVVEILPVKDNLLIPIISALIMKLLK